MMQGKRFSDEDLIQAREAGIRFLINGRSANGLWYDFHTLAGASNEWVSAYVAYSLATAGSSTGIAVASRTLHKLLWRGFWRRGWGYNTLVPPDADSTTWLINLSAALGQTRHWRIKRAIRFLQEHISPDGGIATYANSLPIRLFTKLKKKEAAFTGWCMPHPCVSAAYTLTEKPGHVKVMGYLLTKQSPEGYWPAYWWPSKEYTTALATESFAANGGTANDCCKRALEWAMARAQEKPSSAFSAALLLRILIACEAVPSATADILITRILSDMRPDGSWPAAAQLRIPPPDNTDPDNYRYWQPDAGGGGSIQEDKHRFFTSATILSAIGSYLRHTAAKK